MRKTVIKIFFLMIIGLMAMTVRPVSAQYNQTYHIYLQKAKEAIREKDYGTAILYLETAQTVRPDDPTVTQYLNMAKRALEARVTEAKAIRSKSTATQTADTLPSVVASTSKSSEPTVIKSFSPDRTPFQDTSTIKLPEAPTIKSEPAPSPAIIKTVTRLNSSDVSSGHPMNNQTPMPNYLFADTTKQRKTIYLDDELWALQPDTEVELSLTQELIIADTDIERFLAISPDVIEVTRLGNAEILVTPKAYGRSFLHVWEADKRWTFLVKAILPSQVADRTKISKEELREASSEPFKFHYDMNWNSFNSGPSFDDMDRKSLRIQNYFLLEGPTPYGLFDSFLSTYKTDVEETDVADYSIGLSDAQWKQLSDIDVRLFDANKPISALTMPGRDFRGVVLSAKTVDDDSLTYLRGRDQATFGSLSPRYSKTRDLFFEAGSVSVKPDIDKTISANFARAWGDDKSDTASSNVYSAEYEQDFDRWSLASEAGYDEDQYAQMVWTRYREDDRYLFFTMRNVPPDYDLVTGPPANGGEVGAAVSMGHTYNDIDLTYFLDLYRDRKNENPENPDALNIDFNSSARKELSPKDTVSGNIYFIHTPGLLGSRTDMRLSSGYAHQFSLFWFENSRFSTTGSYQRNRSESSPSSDYDRWGLTPALTVPLHPSLHFNTSYDMYYVDDVAQNEANYPTALNVGLLFNRTLSSKWRTNASIFYRDEENSEDLKSFLAGQDSVTVSSGVTYSPRQGLNIYLDGRARDVLAENDRSNDYVEADIRLGVRSEWDLGLSWNPTGTITGYVFKDSNKNGLKEDSELGIPGVRVKIGDESAVTDQAGWYYHKIQARMVKVSLDVVTIPDGFVFQDVSAKAFDIQHGRYYDGSFPLVTESGIYGVVFVDDNRNGRPDENEEFLSKVKLMLDNDHPTITDLKGAFFFYNISEGEHELRIDMLSLPIDYLPLIPMTNRIKVTEGSTYIFHIP
ncbi:MAG TPA: hypothetical protein VLJ10_04535, partial [Candidatus Bathyarchaeia archaeon]|nr:hypothetical protein [Candidatus Bathyarchaeia archaeon]